MKGLKIYKFLLLTLSVFWLVTPASCSQGSVGESAEMIEPTSHPSLTAGNNYYVSNMTEYNKAVRLLTAGDTITLTKGQWTDCKFIFGGEGSADRPIVLTVEDVNATTIEGVSNLRLYGSYLVIYGLHFTNGYSATTNLIEFRRSETQYASNSVLRNCVIDGYNRKSASEKDVWVSMWGQRNRVDNCYFGTKTNIGVILIVWPNGEGHNQNYHHISCNYFAGRPYMAVNGAETIRIGTSDYSMEKSNTVVEGNYFEYCDGEVEIVSIKSCENRIVGNTFFECEGSVVLRHGNRNEISGNYFINNRKARTGGVRVINEGHRVFNNYFYGSRGEGHRAALCIMKGLVDSPLSGYNQVKDVDISFNTFVDCDTPWQLSYGTEPGQSLLPIDTQVSNNVVYSSLGSTHIKVHDKIDGITFSNNLLVGTSGVEQGTGFVAGSADVRFDEGGCKWAVTDLKSSQNGITKDIDNRNRLNPTSIGAIEASVPFGTVVRPTRKNTGAMWYKHE